MTKHALAALRRHLRGARRALSAAEQRRAQQELLYRVRALPWFSNARRLGFYVASEGEIDPADLVAEALRNDRACYLPVLPPGKDRSMRFARYDGVVALLPRRYGIYAPRGPGIAGWRLAVVIAPLVAFDRAGRRLGRGGGYYDRAFAPRPGRPRPLLVGVAHAFQEVAELPDRAHDVRLDLIVTPNEIIEVQRRTARPTARRSPPTTPSARKDPWP